MELFGRTTWLMSIGTCVCAVVDVGVTEVDPMKIQPGSVVPVPIPPGLYHTLTVRVDVSENGVPTRQMRIASVAST
jgi:hypothetical protein